MYSAFICLKMRQQQLKFTIILAKSAMVSAKSVGYSQSGFPLPASIRAKLSSWTKLARTRARSIFEAVLGCFFSLSFHFSLNKTNKKTIIKWRKFIDIMMKSTAILADWEQDRERLQSLIQTKSNTLWYQGEEPPALGTSLQSKGKDLSWHWK